MGRREISREELEAALRENPEARLIDLKAKFRCGAATIQRELARHGLRTKPLSERAKPWLEGDRNPLRQWHARTPNFGENQKGARNPIHQVRHLYEDPAYLAKVTRGLRQHINAKRGATYEALYGPEKAAQYKARLQQASPARLQKFRRRETWIEVAVGRLLDEIGASYIRQAPVGPYTVDFLVANRLVVQADGDYWHANPKVYPDLKLSRQQHHRRRLDASCDGLCKSKGLRVLRLWEHDLKTNLDDCRQALQRALNEDEGTDT